MYRFHIAIHARPAQVHCVLWLLLVAGNRAWAGNQDDWPTYQHNNARSGVTAELLPRPLTADWQIQPPFAPARGWGEPESTPVYDYGILRINKVNYDDAYQVAVADGALFYCASAENSVHCVDPATGSIRWTVFTEAAPRLAPTVWQGRVYIGADDGLVRCLDAATGRQIWGFCAAPTSERAVSQDRLLSLWPVRTGVVVQDNIAYFGAGLFPAEGLRLYAVDAASGALLWKNDAFDEGGTANLSPQGYLLANQQVLIVPQGRVCPSVFDRATGRLLFHVENGRALSGGSYATLTPRLLYTGTQMIGAYELTQPRANKWGHAIRGWQVCAWFNTRRIVAHDGTIYLATPTEILAVTEERLPAAAEEVDRVRKLRWQHRNALATYERAQAQHREAVAGSAAATRYQADMDRQQPQVRLVAEAEDKLNAYLDEVCRWRLPCQASAALILAGNVLFAGGDGQVLAIDADRGTVLEQHEAKGLVRGLAVARGRLFVSTTTGNITCFRAARGLSEKAAVTPQTLETPHVRVDATAATRGQQRSGQREGNSVAATNADRPAAELAAQAILRAAGVDRGYCLLLGCGDGALAEALARLTSLRIYAVERSAEKVEAARRRWRHAGLYGGRIVVEHGELVSRGFPPYFANLIVDGSAEHPGSDGLATKELLRLLKPHGGVALLRAAARETWRQELSDDVQVERHEEWLRITRGALAGVGWWTHQYADAGNTSCSQDAVVRAPLRPLWFGDPGPQGMLDRHAAGPAPLCADGRIFVQGDDCVTAWDAYNGVALWRQKLDGATRVGMSEQSSNMAAGADSLFVAVGDQCLRLDAATGATRRRYALPARADGAPRRWGWIAVVGQQLFGSRSDTDRPFRNWPVTTGHTSEAVFCLDLDSGATRWLYAGREIPQTALAVGGSAVGLVDAEVSEPERAQALAESAGPDPTPDRRGEAPARSVAKVIVLDAGTGRRRWSRPVELTDLVVAPRGGQANLIYAGDTLLVCSSPSGGDHHLREFQDGQFARRTLIALAADSGQIRWIGPKNYLSRPVVVGDRVYAQPWAYALATGEPQLRPHPLTGELQPWCVHRGAGGACGAISASANSLFFRSDAGACYDLQADQGIWRRGGQRWGCWINAIAAGGLLLVPEGSAECDCPYALQCTTVLAPRPDRPAWSQFDLPQPLVPVQRLGIALGAPGDLRDQTGQLWLSYPRRSQKHGWADCRFAAGEGHGYTCDTDRLDQIGGSDKPWLFAAGARGLVQFTVPLTADQASAAYTIRLGFLQAEAVAVGDRVFDVLLQGNRVLKDFDVVRESGGRYRAVVKEFRGVRVRGKLNVEFRPSGDTGRTQAVLNTLEAIREDPEEAIKR